LFLVAARAVVVDAASIVAPEQYWMIAHCRMTTTTTSDDDDNNNNNCRVLVANNLVLVVFLQFACINDQVVDMTCLVQVLIAQGVASNGHGMLNKFNRLVYFAQIGIDGTNQR
jgi:hypothetical protein